MLSVADGGCTSPRCIEIRTSGFGLCAVVTETTMENSFDSVSYVIRIGKELVHDFDGAGFATSPGQIGSAREVPTREKLEQVLPRGIAVGSGFVIDSYGNTSRQMDVILYEKDFCPVYSINRDSSTTYYPCEGVIAVGEIKSKISSEI